MRVILLLLLVGAAVVVWARPGACMPGLWGPSSGAEGTATPITAPSIVAGGSTIERRGAEIVLEVSEVDLNRELGRQLTGRTLGSTPFGPATLERLQIGLREGRADATGSARVSDNSLPFSSQFTLTPGSNGTVRLNVTRADVAGFAVPEPIRAALEAQAQDQLNGILAREKIRVRTVEIVDGRIQVIGTPGT